MMSSCPRSTSPGLLGYSRSIPFSASCANAAARALSRPPSSAAFRAVKTPKPSTSANQECMPFTKRGNTDFGKPDAGLSPMDQFARPAACRACARYAQTRIKTGVGPHGVPPSPTARMMRVSCARPGRLQVEQTDPRPACPGGRASNAGGNAPVASVLSLPDQKALVKLQVGPPRKKRNCRDLVANVENLGRLVMADKPAIEFRIGTVQLARPLHHPARFQRGDEQKLIFSKFAASGHHFRRRKPGVIEHLELGVVANVAQRFQI